MGKDPMTMARLSQCKIFVHVDTSETEINLVLAV